MIRVAILIDGGHFLKRLPVVRPNVDATDPAEAAKSVRLVFDSKEIKSIVNQQVDRRRKSLSLHTGARCDSPRQRLGTWVGVSLLNFDLAHGVGQSDPDALGNLAGDADGVAAHREAFAVVGNRRFAQRIQIAENVAPLGPHASVVHATIELVAQHQRQERTEDMPADGGIGLVEDGVSRVVKQPIRGRPRRYGPDRLAPWSRSGTDRNAAGGRKLPRRHVERGEVAGVLAELHRDQVDRLAQVAILVRLCCKLGGVGIGRIRTTTVLASCFCTGRTILGKDAYRPPCGEVARHQPSPPPPLPVGEGRELANPSARASVKWPCRKELGPGLLSA